MTRNYPTKICSWCNATFPCRQGAQCCSKQCAGNLRAKPLLAGTRFGRLVVVRPAGRSTTRNAALFECRCDCGSVTIVLKTELTRGHTHSCGCLRLTEITTHGMTKTPEYAIWRAMRARTTNPERKGFKHYGGRGITVCERWQTFENFYADMGMRPSSKHSLDRVDNEKGYEPSNVRWATHKEQHRNTRANVWITYDGRTMLIADWAEEKGMKRNSLDSRINRLKWPIEKALNTPVKFRRK